MNNRHNSMADSAGMTLMDLISSDPTPLAPPSPSSSSSSSPAAMPPPSSGTGKHATTDRKSKRGALLQIQSDTISAAKAALNPVRTNILPQKHNQRKKSVSYAQLERSIHELAATSDQKTSQKQLVHHVFPKLAVYNSVDPSLAPSLLMLDQECEDRTVLRYVYYYLARILADPGSQGLTSGGGIPTPNWDAFADIDAVGAVTRADVVPRIVDRLTSEALNADVEYFGAAGDLGRIDKAVSHHEGEEVEIEYEVDGWFYVKKKRPGRDGKLAGLVPVLYVSQS